MAEMALFCVLAAGQVTVLLLVVRWLHGTVVGTERRVLRPEMAMWRRTVPEPGRNPLVPVVEAMPARGRRALYAAANSGWLGRGTWDGCAFNRAGEILGTPVGSWDEAALALGTTRGVICWFLEVWDRFSGSDRYCTALLRDALEHAGLFDEDDIDTRPAAGHERLRSGSETVSLGPCEGGSRTEMDRSTA
jgi:hypothetical protein